MGGLMQDEVQNNKDAVPWLHSLPVVGNLFSYRNENSTKSELVIFLRPLVIKEASVNDDYKAFRSHLPGKTPLNQPPYGEEKSSDATFQTTQDKS
jgi:general secretion pathway protein D